MKPPTTSEDFVARVKSRLKGKGPETLDLYRKYGTATRRQAASALGCNDRSHSFSYGFQSLRIKKNELLVHDGSSSTKGEKMLVLTERAFFTTQEYNEYKEALQSNSFPELPQKPDKKGGKAAAPDKEEYGSTSD